MIAADALRGVAVVRGGDEPSGILAALGEALGAARAYSIEFASSDLEVGRCNEWSAPGVAKRGDADASARLSLRGLGLAPWAADIAAGASVLDGFGEPARAGSDELARHGVTAIALVPIEVDGTCRGVVGADLRADGPETRALPVPEVVLRSLRALSGALAQDALVDHELGSAVGMLADTPGGVLVMDARSRVQYANLAATQILGYTPAELLSMSAEELMDEGEAERLRVVRERRRAGQITTYEVRVRHKNGEPRELMVTRAPRYREGVFIGNISALVDVTASKRLVREAVLAKEAAERAKDAAAMLVSQLSHELRTPLHAVLGYARLLATDELSADQRDSVGAIIRSGEHLAGLIEAAFDVASIEAKGPTPALRPVPVRDLVVEVVSMLKVFAASAGIQIEIDAPRHGPHVVMAERLRLKQVIVNLLANAVKYSRPPGSVVIGCMAQGTASVRIEIRDAGVGIAAEKMANLFIPFDRLGADGRAYGSASGGVIGGNIIDGIIGSGVGGSGLGLAVTKALVDMMGGSIDVQSVPGRGTTVGVMLAAAPGSAAADEPVVGGADGTSRLRPTRVFVLEDDPVGVETLEDVLRAMGTFDVTGSRFGEDAVACVAQGQPDVVLLDLHLPDHDAGEVLTRLKADPATRAIPVVVLARDVDAAEADRLRTAGASDFVTRPLNVRLLTRTIARHTAMPTRAGFA